MTGAFASFASLWIRPCFQAYYVSFVTKATMDMDNRIRQIALDLNEESLLAKLCAGDMVALEAKYHKSCLTSICNRARSSRSHELRANEKDSNVLHGIVLAELVSYIRYSRRNQFFVSFQAE